MSSELKIITWIVLTNRQDCLGGERIGVEAVHAGEQVAELCAPVPQVVEPGHLSTNRFVDVRHIVSDYRRPKRSRFLLDFFMFTEPLRCVPNPLSFTEDTDQCLFHIKIFEDIWYQERFNAFI
jgi:hypothetical protein